MALVGLVNAERAGMALGSAGLLDQADVSAGEQVLPVHPALEADVLQVQAVEQAQTAGLAFWV